MARIKDKKTGKIKNNGCRVRKDLRLAIYLRDEFTCVYCGENLHHADPNDVTLDHLTCQVDGGTNEPKNLVTACRHCNCTRRDQRWTTFASTESKKIIRRNVRRSIKNHRKLAKEIIEGK